MFVNQSSPLWHESGSHALYKKKFIIPTKIIRKTQEQLFSLCQVWFTFKLLVGTYATAISVTPDLFPLRGWQQLSCPKKKHSAQHNPSEKHKKNTLSSFSRGGWLVTDSVLTPRWTTSSNQNKGRRGATPPLLLAPPFTRHPRKIRHCPVILLSPSSPPLITLHRHA